MKEMTDDLMTTASLLRPDPDSHVVSDAVRKHFTVYIASSRRYLADVRLLHGLLLVVDAKIKVLDWTIKSLDAREDVDQCDEVFSFCRNASMFGDLVIYFGASGQDAGVQVGMAYAAGVPILGIKGIGEKPGIMLNGAVTVWKSILETPRVVQIMANCRMPNCRACPYINSCYVGQPTT